MSNEFYATSAQILPLLLLALMWDSGFLLRLRGQRRLLRGNGSDGVLFWTKPRVRGYVLFLVTVTVSATMVAILILAGFVPDNAIFRAGVSAAIGLALTTLLTRTAVDVVAATGPAPASAPTTVQPPIQATPTTQESTQIIAG